MTAQAVWPVHLLMQLDHWADDATRQHALALADTEARADAARRFALQLDTGPGAMTALYVRLCGCGGNHMTPAAVGPDEPDPWAGTELARHDATHVSVGLAYRILGGCN